MNAINDQKTPYMPMLPPPSSQNLNLGPYMPTLPPPAESIIPKPYLPSTTPPMMDIPLRDVEIVYANLKANNGSITTMGFQQRNQEHAELRTINGREVAVISQKQATGMALTSSPALQEYETTFFVLDSDGSVHTLGKSTSMTSESDDPWSEPITLNETLEQKLRTIDLDAPSDTTTYGEGGSVDLKTGRTEDLIQLKRPAAASVAPILKELESQPTVVLKKPQLPSLKHEPLPPFSTRADDLREFRAHP
jgi:hypothetical protein